MSQVKRPAIRLLIPVMIGTAIYAFGLHFFVLPNLFMEGGVTGISILFNYAFGWKLSVMTLVLNIPLFIIGWRVLGGKQMYWTVIGTLSLAMFLWVMERGIHSGFLVPFTPKNDLLLAALYAGAALGTGLGIVFRFGATTGGADIIARIVSRKYGFSMGQMILIIDALVISLSLLFIPIERVLYTLVAVFVATQIIDFIQAGAYTGKAFSIITEEGRHMAQTITKQIDRGVTIIPATGTYSGVDKQLVYCVVSRQEARKLKAIVHQIDPKAFIVVHDAHDVIGEGFRDS